MPGRDPQSLTPREREVLSLIRLGLTNEEIAARFGITRDGAKYHVSQILSKLGVATREEAARLTVAEAFQLRRQRWWTAWPLWAQVAAGTVVLVTVAGLGLLAWLVITTEATSEVDQLYSRVEQALIIEGQIFHTELSNGDQSGLPPQEIWFDASNRVAHWIPPEGGAWILTSNQIYGPNSQGKSNPECMNVIRYLAPSAIIGLCAAQASELRVESSKFEGMDTVALVGTVRLATDHAEVSEEIRFHFYPDNYLPLAYEVHRSDDADNNPSESLLYQNDFVPRNSLAPDFFDPSRATTNDCTPISQTPRQSPGSFYLGWLTVDTPCWPEISYVYDYNIEGFVSYWRCESTGFFGSTERIPVSMTFPRYTNRFHLPRPPDVRYSLKEFDLKLTALNREGKTIGEAQAAASKDVCVPAATTTPTP